VPRRWERPAPPGTVPSAPPTRRSTSCRASRTNLNVFRICQGRLIRGRRAASRGTIRPSPCQGKQFVFWPGRWCTRWRSAGRTCSRPVLLCCDSRQCPSIRPAMLAVGPALTLFLALLIAVVSAAQADGARGPHTCTTRTVTIATNGARVGIACIQNVKPRPGYSCVARSVLIARTTRQLLHYNATRRLLVLLRYTQRQLIQYASKHRLRSPSRRGGFPLPWSQLTAGRTALLTPPFFWYPAPSLRSSSWM
jgi:hypothetical protein